MVKTVNVNIVRVLEDLQNAPFHESSSNDPTLDGQLNFFVYKECLATKSFISNHFVLNGITESGIPVLIKAAPKNPVIARLYPDFIHELYQHLVRFIMQSGYLQITDDGSNEKLYSLNLISSPFQASRVFKGESCGQGWLEASDIFRTALSMPLGILQIALTTGQVVSLSADENNRPIVVPINQEQDAYVATVETSHATSKTPVKTRVVLDNTTVLSVYYHTADMVEMATHREQIAKEDIEIFKQDSQVEERSENPRYNPRSWLVARNNRGHYG